MREAILILAVAAFLLALTAYRYRKQIRAMLAVWRALKQVREQNQVGTRKGERDRQVPLVNCSKCGKWVAEDQALSIGRSATFCSPECMEHSARSV